MHIVEQQLEQDVCYQELFGQAGIACEKQHEPCAGQGCDDSPANRLQKAPRASLPHADGWDGNRISINLYGRLS